jgi:hypothetical protein
MSMAFATWNEGYVCSGTSDDDWTNLDQLIAGRGTAPMPALGRLLLACFPVVLAAL